MADTRDTLSPKVLGQLLLMQSIIGSLPNEESILAFVCKGLLDVPGVNRVVLHENESKPEESAQIVRLQIKVENKPAKELNLELAAPDHFAPYAHYIDNFGFMLNILLEERNQRRLNERYKAELEERVALRTTELEAEVASRKNAEAALRSSMQLFRAIFEYSTIGMCLTDTGGVLKMVNPAMASILGYSVDELKGRNFSSFTHQDDVDLSFGEIQQLLARHKQSTTFEKRYLHRRGSTIWARVGTFLLRDKQQEPLYFVTHLEDITSNKEAEEKRLELEEQLRQSQKMEAIGTLAGGVAHDFNNLLAVIIGYSELTLLDMQEGHTGSEKIEQVLKAANRAKDLVTQILTYSRKRPQTLTSIKIHEVVEDALRLLRATIPTSIIFEQEIKDCGYILGDIAHFNQILINLCTNGAQAIGSSGGLLRIELDSVVVKETKRKHTLHIEPGNYACLTVRDTGEGIAPENLDRVFDPYFTTKEVGKGSGMGLSVVLGAVKNHHGLIEVDSQLGQGTTFTVYFPKTSPEGLSELIENGDMPTGSERILVVDDEQYIAEVTQAMLQRLGYAVTTTTSPVDALKAFAAEPDQFDLVITDQTMPQMSGDRLATSLLAIKPQLPIILCSGFSSTIDSGKAAALGIAKYLLKPVDNRRLAHTVRFLLDKCRVDQP